MAAPIMHQAAGRSRVATAVADAPEVAEERVTARRVGSRALTAAQLEVIEDGPYRELEEDEVHADDDDGVRKRAVVHGRWHWLLAPGAVIALAVLTLVLRSTTLTRVDYEILPLPCMLCVTTIYGLRAATRAAERDPSCRGIVLPGDVTVPAHAGMVQAVAVWLSLLPHLLVIYIVGVFALFGGSRLVPVLLAVPTVLLLSELLVKRALKQPRPAGSLVRKSHGMPSSHSVICGLIVAWHVLDSFALELMRALGGPQARAYVVADFLAVTSSPLVRPAPVWARVWYNLVLLPPFSAVPWARVVLRDHTRAQVLVGAACGVAFALPWFFFTECVLYPWLQGLCDWDMRPGCFVQPWLTLDGQLAARTAHLGASAVLPSAAPLSSTQQHPDTASAAINGSFPALDLGPGEAHAVILLGSQLEPGAPPRWT